MTHQYVDRQWESGVWDVFESDLARKYPCNSSGSDASLTDYAAFFAPDSGKLALFLKDELGVFLKDDRTPQRVYDRGLHLGPQMVNALRKGDALARAMFNPAGELGVRLTMTAKQPVTVHGNPPQFKATQIILGSRKLIYDMGRYIQQAFPWPDPDGAGKGRVFVLCYTANCQKPTENAVDPSEWALFRLLGQASIPEDAANRNEFEIRFAQEADQSYRIAVPYGLRADSRYHPFSQGFLAFNCPRRLAE